MLNSISHSVGSTTLQQPHNSDQPEATMEKRYTPTPEPASIQGQIAFFERKAKDITSKYTTGANQLTRTCPRTDTQNEEKPKAKTLRDNRSTMGAIHRLSLKLLEETETSKEHTDQIKQLESHVDALSPDNTEPMALSALISKNESVIRHCKERLAALKDNKPRVSKFYREVIEKRELENKDLSIAIALTAKK